MVRKSLALAAIICRSNLARIEGSIILVSLQKGFFTRTVGYTLTIFQANFIRFGQALLQCRRMQAKAEAKKGKGVFKQHLSLSLNLSLF